LFKVLFILFITIPIIEVYLLIEVGRAIGAASTILLIIFTAVLGIHLLRIQGIQTLARVQQSVDRGELPATELIEGLMLFIAGALLLTPGFFTDTIGFLCLVPNIRRRIAASLLTNFINSRIQTHEERNVTLEGEYWEEPDDVFPPDKKL